jgi:excisionase family DNA binding protein
VNFEIEERDIERIARKVTDLLRPLLPSSERPEDKGGGILDVEGLAGYLRVDRCWIYKKTSLKEIPFFKAGRYIRFRKKDIDRWIESQTRRPIPPLGMVKRRGVAT